MGGWRGRGSGEEGKGLVKKEGVLRVWETVVDCISIMVQSWRFFFFHFFTLQKYTLRAGIGRSKERLWRRISGPLFFFARFFRFFVFLVSSGGFVVLHGCCVVVM